MSDNETKTISHDDVLEAFLTRYDFYSAPTALTMILDTCGIPTAKEYTTDQVMLVAAVLEKHVPNSARVVTKLVRILKALLPSDEREGRRRIPRTRREERDDAKTSTKDEGPKVASAKADTVLIDIGNLPPSMIKATQVVTIVTDKPAKLHWGVNGWKKVPSKYQTKGSGPAPDGAAIQSPMSESAGTWRISIGPFSGNDVLSVEYNFAYDDGTWGDTDRSFDVL